MNDTNYPLILIKYYSYVCTLLLITGQDVNKFHQAEKINLIAGDEDAQVIEEQYFQEIARGNNNFILILILY